MDADASQAEPVAKRVVLVGNPNVGKTTLFNRLCGLRNKTSNFPGTTQDARTGHVRHADAHLTDLPGIYSLEIDSSESAICRGVLAGTTAPGGEVVAAPDAVCVVVDATNIPRNLVLVAEAARRMLPMVVALNRVDVARKRGIHADEDVLAETLGVPVIVCSARTGEGLDDLARAMTKAAIPKDTPAPGMDGAEAWADRVSVAMGAADQGEASASLTDRLDHAFTHPLLGLGVFIAIMGAVFWTIFRLAAFPMDWIDGVFGNLAGTVEASLPAGILTDLLANGVIAGVGATVIFLPQIVILFFLIALLEDTGYLARASFVMDRVLRPFGMPGQAFVPMLSSHACALPGIMACRSIPDRRERLAAILVAPFMSCTARIPVYVMLTGLLFADSATKAALAFMGCYALGIFAGLFSSLIARRTILRGPSVPMAMELPTYTLPSVKRAAGEAAERGWLFLRKAGTVILAISIVLWWMSAYPKTADSQELIDARSTLAVKNIAVRPASPEALEQHVAEVTLLSEVLAKLEREYAIDSVRNSFAGKVGQAVEPIFAPMGADWRLSIGIVTSFAAREVFVSTMAVVIAGEDDAEAEGVLDEIASATRDNGTLLFYPAAAWALLVYYVLAMQCLPTLAVTAREAGGAKWALLQLAWMGGLAYVAGVAVFQVMVLAS